MQYRPNMASMAIARDFSMMSARGQNQKIDVFMIGREIQWPQQDEVLEVFMPDGHIIRKKVHIKTISSNDRAYRKAYVVFKVHGLSLEYDLLGMYVRRPVAAQNEIAV